MKIPALETPQPSIKMLSECFLKALFLLIYSYLPATLIGCTFTAPIFLLLLNPERNVPGDLILISMFLGGLTGVFFAWILAIPALLLSIPIIMLLLIKKTRNIFIWVVFGITLGSINAALFGLLLDYQKTFTITFEMSFVPTGATVGGLMCFSMWQKVSKL